MPGPCELVEVQYPFLAVLCSNFLSSLRIVDQFQDGVTFEQQSNVVGRGNRGLDRHLQQDTYPSIVREFENIQGKLQDL